MRQALTEVASTEIVTRYLRGELEAPLADAYQVSRYNLRRILRNAGVQRRSQSDAGRLRAAARQPVECEACGKVIVRFRSQLKGRIFCSRRCTDSNGRRDVNCSWVNCTTTMPARVSTHHGRAVYKTTLTKRGDYVAYPLCEVHHARAKHMHIRLNSLFRLWREPDRIRPSRALSARGVRFFLFERASGCCEKCAVPLVFDAPPKTWITDHIVPIFRGGLTTLANLQVLCAACDRIKSGKEKSEVSRLRHHFNQLQEKGPRWMTHSEKDLLITSLTQEVNSLRAQLAAKL